MKNTLLAALSGLALLSATEIALSEGMNPGQPEQKGINRDAADQQPGSQPQQRGATGMQSTGQGTGMQNREQPVQKGINRDASDQQPGSQPEQRGRSAR